MALSAEQPSRLFLAVLLLGRISNYPDKELWALSHPNIEYLLRTRNKEAMILLSVAALTACSV